jgi:hypothetical protein
MKNAHATINRFARRYAASRLLAGAIAALLLTAPAARAEVWVCSDHKTATTDVRPPLELEARNGLLIERPLGSPRYRMLTDNDYAIIAIDDYAGFEPVLGMVNIFVSTVTINKATGNFAIATTADDKVLAPRTGHCRSFEEATDDKVLAQRR